MEYRKFGDAYIVRLDRDEEILAQLKIFAEKEQVKLASVTGLGAVKDFTVGVFDSSAKAYKSNRFQGVQEPSRPAASAVLWVYQSLCGENGS